MLKTVKAWFKSHIDYHIVGEQLLTEDGIHYYKRYIKRYFWKRKGGKRNGKRR